MWRRPLLLTIAGICCFAAAIISSSLLSKHFGSTGPAWFESGCADAAEDSRVDCAAVLASPYSYFPARTSTEPDGVPRVPVAFLGLLYYSLLLVWLLGVGAVSWSRRRWHWVPLIMIGGGLTGSGYYSYIMFTALDQWCPWCLVTHGLNLVIAVCVVLLWPRRDAADGGGRSKQEARRAVEAHPSGRVMGVTMLAMVITVLAMLHVLGLRSWKRQAEASADGFQQCLAAVRRMQSDADGLVANWQRSPQRPVRVRGDDPVRTTSSPRHAPLDVVVFSDFECPSCRRFERFVEDKAQKLFDEHLRIVFKHYPLDTACNPLVSRAMHPHACRAARMAEAGRLHDGNEGFWRVHDHLFEHRDRLQAGRLTDEEVAALLGVETSALLSAMQDAAVTQRIQEDIALARECQIRGTPAVFVDGRAVDTLARTEIGFWDALATAWWKKVGEPRPAHTLPARDTPTGPGEPAPSRQP